MRTRTGATPDSDIETIAVAHVEAGPTPRSYSWSSLVTAVKNAATVKQMIAITHCRMSTGDLLVDDGIVSIVLEPPTGLYDAPNIDYDLSETIGALQAALDTRELQICAVDSGSGDTLDVSKAKIDGDPCDRRSPGGRTYRECALEVSARIAGKRTRTIGLSTPTGDVVVLRVPPKVRLLDTRPNRPVQPGSTEEELIRAVQPLCCVTTVTGRAMLMDADMMHLVGSEIRVPASMARYKRIAVYGRNDIDRQEVQ